VTLGRRIGLYRYCVSGDIGRGNFSRVKLAIHQLTKGLFLRFLQIISRITLIFRKSTDKVAIKVVDRAKLDCRALRMLSREIETLENVHHPNILR
jgi:serine/threonine-protein kinase NIM1